MAAVDPCSRRVAGSSTPAAAGSSSRTPGSREDVWRAGSRAVGAPRRVSVRSVPGGRRRSRVVPSAPGRPPGRRAQSSHSSLKQNQL